MASLQIKRGTRLQLDTAATASGLKVGELYLITDENRLAVGTAINAYQVVGKADDYATAAQGALADSAVQPAAIANFETTTQLNTRDTNNRNRTNHTGTQTASTISDFDAEVSNNTDVAANTSARHVAVTVVDSPTIDLTLTGQQISASLVAGSIDETKLDTSVNASLDLADSALQPGTIGVTVQPYNANTVIDANYVHTDNNYTTTEKNKLAGIESGATADQTPNEILDAIKTVDGTGSGLDADTVDGIEGADIITTTGGQAISGSLTATTFTSTQATGTAPFSVSSTTVVSNLNADLLNGLNSTSFLRSDTPSTILTTGRGTTLGTESLQVATLDNTPPSVSWHRAGYSAVTVYESESQLYINPNTGNGGKIWHKGNDGSGSTLDADLLDGLEGTAFTKVSQPIVTVTYNDGGNSTLDHSGGNCIFFLASNSTSTTIVHSNVPASVRYAFELHLTWTAGAITFPGSWTLGDSPPSTTGNYIITGITINGGTDWALAVMVL